MDAKTAGDQGPAGKDKPAKDAPARRRKRTRRLTVEQAVDEALQFNRALKQSNLSVSISDTLQDEARAGLLPTLVARGSFTRVDESPKAVAPELGTSFSVGPRDVFAVGVDMDFPIYAFGRHLNTYRAAVLSRQRTVADQAAAESDVAAAVTAAAFDLLEIIRGVEVARTTEKALDRQVQDAQARLEAKTVTREAVLEAEVQRDSTRRDREKLESLIPIRRMLLNRLLGRSVHAPTEIVDAPDERAPIWKRESLEEEALAQRAELRAARLQVRVAERAYRAAVGSALPELRGSLGWETSDSPFRNPKDTGTLALTLDIPIFTGGRNRALIQRTRYEVGIAKLQLRDLAADIRTEVAEAHREVMEGFKDIAVFRHSIEQAEESLRITSEKFRLGRATSREVLDSTSQLTDARVSYVTAIYTYNIALRQLHRARGADPRRMPFFEVDPEVPAK